MQFITDLIRSIYSISFIGKELSRRAVSQVILAFCVMTFLFVIFTGGFYVHLTDELIAIVGKEASYHAVPFSIVNGELSSPVDQPYIVTDQDLTAEFYASIATWMGKSPLMRTLTFNQIQRFTEREKTTDYSQGGEFLFVLDTAGTYRENIDETKFKDAFIVTEKAVRYTQRRSETPVSRQQLFAELKQDIMFTPEGLDKIVTAFQRSMKVVVWGSVFVVTVIRFLVKILFVALVAYVSATLQKKRVAFGRVVAIAVYALTHTVIIGIMTQHWQGVPQVIIFAIYSFYVFMATAHMADNRAAISKTL